MVARIDALEHALNAFDAATRREALDALIGLALTGEIPLAPEAEVANMHCHTFFSYNGYGYSPTALAWLARRQGIKLLGIVDFDVLDGVEEFLEACDAVGIRGSAGMETRAYVPEFAAREINSPGEPGVYYHMGIGFTASRIPAGDPEAAAALEALRRRASERNRDMVERINAYLDPIVVDLERDVLPLTPAGNATERHICAAYVAAAARLPDPAAFWAERLRVERAQVAALLDDGPQIQNLVRSRLMKRGGVGYAQPGPETFPTVEEVNRVTLACGALPCITWLDGTSAGEQAAGELFALMIAKGAAALNIVPDRNWNLKDPQDKARKLRELYAVVDLARELDLPLNIGTEMNAYGQRRVDDFDAPELAPVREAFIDGAYFIYGHTVLQRALGLGYQSAWARAHLPARADRNAFYAQAGRRIFPCRGSRLKLAALGREIAPDALLAAFQPPA